MGKAHLNRHNIHMDDQNNQNEESQATNNAEQFYLIFLFELVVVMGYYVKVISYLWTQSLISIFDRVRVRKNVMVKYEKIMIYIFLKYFALYVEK